MTAQNLERRALAALCARAGGIPLAIELAAAWLRLIEPAELLVAHEHADLTATVQAGARLVEVNRALAAHGQFLPIDSAFEGATIGGAIATNESGPLRHRYGAPRDVLIGIRVALCDGRVVKAGGTVVKNVAGYDLSRLVSGSFGTLAAICRYLECEPGDILGYEPSDDDLKAAD